MVLESMPYPMPYQMGDEGWNWLYGDGCREDQPNHIADSPDHLVCIYLPQQLELTRG